MLYGVSIMNVGGWGCKKIAFFEVIGIAYLSLLQLMVLICISIFACKEMEGLFWTKN